MRDAHAAAVWICMWWRGCVCCLSSRVCDLSRRVHTPLVAGSLANTGLSPRTRPPAAARHVAIFSTVH